MVEYTEFIETIQQGNQKEEEQERIPCNYSSQTLILETENSIKKKKKRYLTTISHGKLPTIGQKRKSTEENDVSKLILGINRVSIQEDLQENQELDEAPLRWTFIGLETREMEEEEDDNWEEQRFKKIKVYSSQ